MLSVYRLRDLAFRERSGLAARFSLSLAHCLSSIPKLLTGHSDRLGANLTTIHMRGTRSIQDRRGHIEHGHGHPYRFYPILICVVLPELAEASMSSATMPVSWH